MRTADCPNAMWTADCRRDVDRRLPERDVAPSYSRSYSRRVSYSFFFADHIRSEKKLSRVVIVSWFDRAGVTSKLALVDLHSAAKLALVPTGRNCVGVLETEGDRGCYPNTASSPPALPLRQIWSLVT